ncbi:PLD nuclease N-terminal domain-containing protein [Nesterenkonia alba]|uniref:PLD nuclease N-terminal domain-containing protein n=1 Tax=Nesterenkonia alba TaxID=515814 RepID=UPI0003B5D525|nr:PLD nuclease N-terminal domain-containing protein [Nesterenkonia alba]
MVRLFIGFGVVALALLIYCTIDAAQTPRHQVRALPKAAWIAIIILVPLIGPGLWLGLGRPWQTRKTQPARPAAPDDDPEFLKQMEIRRRQQQRAEEERKRRREQEIDEAHKRRQQQEDHDDAATSPVDPQQDPDEDPDAEPPRS